MRDFWSDLETSGLGLRGYRPHGIRSHVTCVDKTRSQVGRLCDMWQCHNMDMTSTVAQDCACALLLRRKQPAESKQDKKKKKTSQDTDLWELAEKVQSTYKVHTWAQEEGCGNSFKAQLYATLVYGPFVLCPSQTSIVLPAPAKVLGQARRHLARRCCALAEWS